MFTKISKRAARDPWFKVVEMLQQNWAVIVPRNDHALIVFYDDNCHVFDQITSPSVSAAKGALLRNGFSKFLEDEKAQEFIGLPAGKFKERVSPFKIYSSGKHWH